jgi:protein involved in polysaccharide export with SLBB domain
VPLEPWDNVLIPRRSDFSLVSTVAIAGQVKHPGRYPLETRTDRITDLIQRAGGLTDIAYPGGVEFFRAPTGLALVENRRGRIGIDLPRVLKDAKFRDNLILQPGDSLFIPEFIPVVLVDGAVNSPGNVAFTPGKSLDWYVRSAGGYAQTADRNRAYVTQPDGTIESVNRKFLLADDVPHPRPGAVITVPVHNPALDKPSNVPTIIGTAAQILASLITIIVVAKQ